MLGLLLLQAAPSMAESEPLYVKNLSPVAGLLGLPSQRDAHTTARGAFGGGEGEDSFASFLRDAQAENLVSAGGIGLAESLFDAMKARANA